MPRTKPAHFYRKIQLKSARKRWSKLTRAQRSAKMKAVRNGTTTMKTSKTYKLTVRGKSVLFMFRKDKETFNDALSRGAAELGYRGGAWMRPNFQMNLQVTVCDKPATPKTSNARQSYTDVCHEVFLTVSP